MPVLTPFRGDSSQLLLFKIASCLSDGTGVLTIAEGDARYLRLSGGTLTGLLNINAGTTAVAAPALAVTQIWNGVGIAMTGLSVDITNTNSAAGSFLFNVLEGGVTKFHVAQGGNSRFTKQDATNVAMNLFLRKRGDATNADNPIASGAGIGSIFGSGWNGTGNVQSASMRFIAEELFSATNSGTKIDFTITLSAAAGSITALTLGNLGASFGQSVNFPLGAKSAAYTMTARDYFINVTANTFTIDLPSASGIVGRVYIVKNSGAGVVTIDPNGAQTIDGAATATIAAGASLRFVVASNSTWVSF